MPFSRRSWASDRRPAHVASSDRLSKVLVAERDRMPEKVPPSPAKEKGRSALKRSGLFPQSSLGLVEQHGPLLLGEAAARKLFPGAGGGSGVFHVVPLVPALVHASPSGNTARPRIGIGRRGRAVGRGLCRSLPGCHGPGRRRSLSGSCGDHKRVQHQTRNAKQSGDGTDFRRATSGRVTRHHADHHSLSAGVASDAGAGAGVAVLCAVAGDAAP